MPRTRRSGPSASRIRSPRLADRAPCSGGSPEFHGDFPEPPGSDVTQGTHFTQTLKAAGTPFQVEWTAETVDGPKSLRWTGKGPAGSSASTSYELTDHEGGTRFGYDNDFSLPVGKVGEEASGVVSGAAEREANDSLAKLKALAER